MDLALLAAPFPAEDIEWRVSRAGIGKSGPFALVLAYITARAIQSRLDEVCGVTGWRLEEPRVLEIAGRAALACGLAIRCGDEWIVKWDVAEPTQVEAAKGAWSGAMKRAGAQWGIGRYLYHLDETFAEVCDAPISGAKGWRSAKLPDKHGGGSYYWRAPTLPAWALPKEPEHAVSAAELNALKRAWRAKCAPTVRSPKDLAEGFARFVASVAGEFPSADIACWTRDILERCTARVAATTEPGGIDSDVPFGGAK